MTNLINMINVTPKEAIWVGVGMLGQLMFSMRFLIQWLASEKQRRSVIPIAFWYFSIAGSLILLSYAIYRLDPVFILGQSAGLFIYSRNLFLIRREAVAGPGPGDLPR